MYVYSQPKIIGDMLSGLFKNSSVGAKLLLTIIVIVISTLILSVLGIVSAIPIFHIDIQNLGNAMNPENQDNVAFMKYFQTFSSIGIFVLPAFISAFLLSGKVFDFLFLNKKSSFIVFAMLILVMIFALPIINYLAAWNAKLILPEWLSGLEQMMRASEENATKITELFLNANSIGVLFVNLFVIALIPAVGEELIFRGLFQKLFTEWTRNAHLGIWIAAFLFSAMHMQFYGFIPRMVLGALFGYMLYWSKNMWLPIVAHFCNNAFAVIAYYMINKSVVTVNLDELGTGKTALTQVLFSMLIVSAILYFLYKELQAKSQAENKGAN